MKKVTLLFAAVLVFGAANIAKAQKTDSHNLYIKIEKQAMLSLESNGSSDIRFESEAFANAGDELTFEASSSNQRMWLNYSSVVSSGGSNTISATISQLPTGLKVQVATSESAVASAKKGHTGKGHTVDLTTGGVTVVDDIKSCYTGTGTEKGHELVYTVSTDDDNYGSLIAADHNLTVTYTITEN